MDLRESHSANLHLAEVTVDASPQTVAQAQELLLEYGRFILAQPGVTGFCYGSLEQEAARLPVSYIEQGGGCLMAHVDVQPAGFVAWRTISAEVAPDAWELKRLWVRPVARGLSLGRALTRAVLDRAQAAGRKQVFLDTVPNAMAAALRIYLELGFRPCAPYNDNPVEGIAYFVANL
jgi:ribosomal protein S18 acetylase RimI-like enzyme